MFQKLSLRMDVLNLHMAPPEYMQESKMDGDYFAHEEAEATEYDTGPSGSDPLMSPNESAMDFVPRMSSTPRYRPPTFRGHPRSNSICLPMDSASHQSLDERLHQAEQQLVQFRLRENHLLMTIESQAGQMREDDQRITELIHKAQERDRLQSQCQKLQDQNLQFAEREKEHRARQEALETEKKQLFRFLQVEQKKMEEVTKENEKMEQLLRDSELRVDEKERSFSSQLRDAHAQLEALPDLLERQVFEEKRQVQSELSILEARHRQELENVRGELQRECETRGTIVAEMQQRIADLELMVRDPVVGEGIEITRSAPSGHTSILEEIYEVEIPANVQQQLAAKVQAIEAENARLRQYMGKLLARVIEQNPQLLEHSDD